MEHVNEPRGDVRRRRRAVALPESKAAAVTLELLELLDPGLEQLAIPLELGDLERRPELRGGEHREEGRRPLLGATVGIFDEITCSLLKPYERGGGELDPKPANLRQNSGGNR